MTVLCWTWRRLKLILSRNSLTTVHWPYLLTYSVREIVFGCPSATSIRPDSWQILLPPCYHDLNDFDKTDMEYSLALPMTLLDSGDQRSKVNVTAGRWGGEGILVNARVSSPFSGSYLFRFGPGPQKKPFQSRSLRLGYLLWNAGGNSGHWLQAGTNTRLKEPHQLSNATYYPVVWAQAIRTKCHWSEKSWFWYNYSITLFVGNYDEMKLGLYG